MGLYEYTQFKDMVFKAEQRLLRLINFQFDGYDIERAFNHLLKIWATFELDKSIIQPWIAVFNDLMIYSEEGLTPSQIFTIVYQEWEKACQQSEEPTLDGLISQPKIYLDKMKEAVENLIPINDIVVTQVELENNISTLVNLHYWASGQVW